MWGNVTTLVTAVVTGIAVLLAGNIPWLVLAQANVRLAPFVPWAPLPMAVYLLFYWRYISGRSGNHDTASWRRDQLRAPSLSFNVWASALVTGLAGFGALLSLIVVMGRLVSLPAPESAPALPPGMSAATLFVLLVMASVVAGITEEAGFRGYMQTPIERRFGLLPAILVSGTMFGLLHFPNHPAQTLTLLPYYIAVAALYSGMTFASGSILPALVLHAGGDVWSLARQRFTGAAEWQLTTSAGPVWQAGMDQQFALAVLTLVGFTALTLWLGVMTARVARDRGVRL